MTGKMWAGCRLSFLVLLLVPLGCRHNSDLVERELRERDKQFREALDELGKAEHHNLAQQHEIEALRHGATITSEQAAQTFGLRRITFGRGTGGVDNDSLPGDEALQVILEPRETDDHIIKAPGTLYVLAVEINPQGLKTPFSSWTVSPEQLRRSWKQGLLSTGYSLILPWKNFPLTENVRVVGRFVSADNRVYETDKDIKVRLVPGAPRRPEGPLDCPIPPQAIEPFTVPTAHTDRRPANNAAAASHWQAVPLDGAVQLGQPIAMPPAPPGVYE
jgi:hypothetical protein